MPNPVERTNAKEVDALAFFLKPYAIDLVTMDQAQRDRVPMALALNLRDALDAPDDVLRRRAFHAVNTLMLCGAVAVWNQFVATSLAAEVTA